MTETYTTIALQIYGLLDNVPAGVSGNTMLAVIDRAANRVQNYTGNAVGSPSFTSQYVPAIVYAACAEVATVMAFQGSDKNYSLGDLSVEGLGIRSSTFAVSEKFEELAKKELKALGQRSTVYRTY